MSRRTSYLLFLDESGSHDMERVDQSWPVFGLAGLLVGERHYATSVCKAVCRLKDRFRIDRGVPLHSHDIRRRKGAFSFLNGDEDMRRSFYEGINHLFASLRFRVFAVLIDKIRLDRRFVVPVNPYKIAISQLLSIVCGPARCPGPWRPRVTKIIAEARGQPLDKSLQREYQRFHNSGLRSFKAAGVSNRRPQTVGRLFPDEINFATKQIPLPGLELIDLAIYPIARAFVNEDYSNPAFNALCPRLERVVVFPQPAERIAQAEPDRPLLESQI